MLSYIEISKENLLHNFDSIKSIVKPGTKIAAVIKANAYGHGQNEIAQILEDKVDYFQIDDARELNELRKVTKKPILVLGYVAIQEMEKALQNEGIFSVYDIEQIIKFNEAANKLNKKAEVHVKIDACLGRQGVLLDSIQEIINVLKESKNLEVKGIYSHFANIEDTADFSHAQKQINTFEKALDIFKENGFKNLETHISASSGIMVWESEKGNSSIVRAGIGLYGMWPSEELKERFGDIIELKPVMRWVTHVAQVKTLPANYSIGYGLTHITSEPTRVAIIPQGYSDGYDRGFSSTGEVLIQNTRCKVLGRVAMNMFVVDVNHLENINMEDEVVLLGKQGRENITAEEMAEKIGTINYEITTRVLGVLPKVVK
ncbi:MAG: hypothetical protein ACD_5C00167G0004 [uncultured bacterium]|nr:MAG: hypothetical protein ACD_5C00167G0004 [uncultured bacterium]